jgi:2-octaprenyl-6-methoxyphenol hydroxylase
LNELEAPVDVLIAGGGPVGLSLALALTDSGLSVQVVDGMADAQVAALPDERHLALSEVSCRALEAFGLWSRLGAEPIRGLHISSRGDFGSVYWRAEEQGLERFGAVARAKALLQGLRAAVRARSDVALAAPARIVAAEAGAEGVTVTVEGLPQTTMAARLLVIADGADSALRRAAGISATIDDYGVDAICCAVRPARAHAGTAYERFTRTGPVALLPQAGGQCGAVHVVERAALAGLLALDDAAYAAALQEAFGWRLGALRVVGPRVSYPLRRVAADRLVAPRQVLIGNAAQAVHPIGAQGFNLGMRDALALAERLAGAKSDPGAPDVLADYAAARRSDRDSVLADTHRLALATTSGLPGVSLARSLALLLADRVEPVRAHVINAGMGFRGRTPALARRA